MNRLRHCQRQKRLLSVLFWFWSTLLIVSAGVWAVDSPLRDDWSVAEKDGNAVGLYRLRVWPAENGFHYTADATVQIDFAGSGPIRVTQAYDVVTDPKGIILAFDMLIQVNDSRSTQHGKLGAYGLEVTLTKTGGKPTTETFSAGQPIYFEDALLERSAVNGLPQPGRSVLVWDFTTASPRAVSYAIEESMFEYKGKLTRGFTLRDTRRITTFVDSQGTIYMQDLPAEQITTRLIDESEIPELKSLSVDTLSVPSNLVVNRPFTSTASSILVTWQDVSPELFNWEDNRQRLVEQKATDSPQGRSVLLELRRDDRDFSGKLAIPMRNETFLPYLADDEFVKPSSPTVQQAAKTILTDEKDAWAATQKLVGWVFNFIKPAMIPETLTVDQILEKKQGKCVEYAVLFASLARAVGLPTRMVLGERFESNMWIGHMWNEVWLGEWVAVDASHNQVAPDALLLKLVHSDTVMGTQRVRWGLVGKLGIVIEDVSLPAETIDDIKTGVNGQTYTNTDFGGQITAPENWSIVEAKEQGLPMAVMTPADVNIQSIMLMFSVPIGTKAEHIMAARIPALKGALPSFKLLEMAERKLGAEEHLAATAAWLMGQDDAVFRQENWIVVNGDIAFLFVFSAPSDAWTDAEDDFQQIRNSFRSLR